MKKLMLSFFTMVLIIASSCKNETKKQATETKETKEITTTFTVKPAATTVKWTAYKTTAKKPVSGIFKILKFEKKTGNTPMEALNGLTFSIPVSSIFSDNEVRDQKLITSFFGAMLNTELLKGTISFKDAKNCNASITMNGETHDLPLQYTIEGNKISLTGTMNLQDWKAETAIASLNKVCFDLHKGEDGISKTWNDVTINITSILSN
ncbi:MAG: YceI family protein [Flavobacteriales bacterium]